MSSDFITPWLKVAFVEECCLIVHQDCDGIIDMHFILVLYKYKYIINKISHFLEMFYGVYSFILNE